MTPKMSTPVFGDEKPDEKDLTPLKDEKKPDPPKKRRFDKIFNNDYNSGNLDFEEFGPPRVDQDYIDEHMECYYDAAEYYAKNKLTEKIDEYFKNHELGETMHQKRKIPKQMLPKIYLAIKGAFEEDELTESEFFINVAEYFGMSYDVLYENIPAIFREELVREMDGKYGMLAKKGIRKLF